MKVPEKQFAVDVGNSRIKIGYFEDSNSALNLEGTRFNLQVPTESLDITAETLKHDGALLDSLGDWLGKLKIPSISKQTSASLNIQPPNWWVGSVNDSLTARLSFAIEQLSAGTVRLLSQNDIPMDIQVKQPERVGIDRLLAALAVKHICNKGEPAIVIDLGTAITVDLLSAAGAFEGGAILPGIGMSAEAMASQTEALPLLAIHELSTPPSPVGKSTQAAIESGLFWGAVGAIRELVVQQSKTLDILPTLYFTGGAAPQVTSLFTEFGSEDNKSNVHHYPYLVLSGIMLVGKTLQPNR